ncbi:von Willebrand factor type A protein [Tolypothrix sp. PCC 7601]|nr:von Willebrand factor type A protein [Tolypothrix sp. PCC 7601]
MVQVVRLVTTGNNQRNTMMSDRDYTLIIDKSGSMSTPDQAGGRNRWEIAQESTLALARKCEQFDPDGITVYVFSGRFKRYDDVTSAKVAQIFQENDPAGTTNLAGVLQDALNNYFKRKAAGKTKPNGETILVITDGEPDDRKAVFEVIINATRQMERDEELAISMIQVGSDSQATKFLKALDDQLQGVGAKFDICDTVTLDDLEEMSLADVLMNAITD